MFGTAAALRKRVGDGEYESTLERDLAYLLEQDRAVTEFEVQPLTVPVPGRRPYTPDVRVVLESGATVLVEVKHQADLVCRSWRPADEWDTFRRKLRGAARFARERGWLFRVVTERDIRTPYLINVTRLRAYQVCDDAGSEAELDSAVVTGDEVHGATAVVVQGVREALTISPLSLGALIERVSIRVNPASYENGARTPGITADARKRNVLGNVLESPRAVVLPVIYRMLVHRQLGFDWARELTPHSLIMSAWRPEDEPYAPWIRGHRADAHGHDSTGARAVAGKP